MENINKEIDNIRISTLIKLILKTTIAIGAIYGTIYALIIIAYLEYMN